MQPKKILFAGSHAGSTAIAVIEEIKKRNLNLEIHWLGMEYKNFDGLNVIFHSFESGKIENKFTKNTLPKLLRIPFSFLRGYKMIKKIDPDFVFSFGSAAGAIASFWSNFMSVPVIIHEQTATAGRANIFSSHFAKKILVARESSLGFFNKHKTEVIGNPINASILKHIGDPKNSLVKAILITGGSQGSKIINDALLPILPRLLRKYYVFHQTGELHFEDFKKIKETKLDKALGDKYLPFGQTSTENMAEIIAKADIAISRSGANTVSELITLRKPTILIPIPWTYNDEQTANAKYMENLGLATILNQDELTPQKLLLKIDYLVENYKKIILSTKDFVSPDIHSSKYIVDLIQSMCDKK